jgi:hypothetical protein
MSFSRSRAAKTSREILQLGCVEIRLRYCDKRAGGRYRHKIYVTITFGNVREAIQTIQSIIKRNYPESFPYVYKGNVDSVSPTFLQIVWVSKKELYAEEVFKVILEENGYLIERAAG